LSRECRILIAVCKRIYLDTDLWNALFNQKINPDKLMQRLREKGAYLVFSSHNLYEIAKSFHRTKDQTKAKGKELVAFLMKFFEGPILHPIESGELLKAEANVNKFMRAPFPDEIFV
jgi:predicted nucleic acid-binding protein